jgi:hypothetical protein
MGMAAVVKAEFLAVLGATGPIACSLLTVGVDIQGVLF